MNTLSPTATQRTRWKMPPRTRTKYVPTTADKQVLEKLAAENRKDCPVTLGRIARDLNRNIHDLRFSFPPPATASLLEIGKQFAREQASAAAKKVATSAPPPVVVDHWQMYRQLNATDPAGATMYYRQHLER